jgi:hypothetical protein
MIMINKNGADKMVNKETKWLFYLLVDGSKITAQTRPMTTPFLCQ